MKWHSKLGMRYSPWMKWNLFHFIYGSWSRCPTATVENTWCRWHLLVKSGGMAHRLLMSEADNFLLSMLVETATFFNFLILKLWHLMAKMKGMLILVRMVNSISSYVHKLLFRGFIRWWWTWTDTWRPPFSPSVAFTWVFASGWQWALLDELPCMRKCTSRALSWKSSSHWRWHWWACTQDWPH